MSPGHSVRGHRAWRKLNDRGTETKSFSISLMIKYIFIDMKIWSILFGFCCNFPTVSGRFPWTPQGIKMLFFFNVQTFDPYIKSIKWHVLSRMFSLSCKKRQQHADIKDSCAHSSDCCCCQQVINLTHFQRTQTGGREMETLSTWPGLFEIKVKNCRGGAGQVKIEQVRGDELVTKSVRRVKDRLEKMEKNDENSLRRGGQKVLCCDRTSCC